MFILEFICTRASVGSRVKERWKRRKMRGKKLCEQIYDLNINAKWFFLMSVRPVARAIARMKSEAGETKNFVLLCMLGVSLLRLSAQPFIKCSFRAWFIAIDNLRVRFSCPPVYYKKKVQTQRLEALIKSMSWRKTTKTTKVVYNCTIS